MNSSKPEMDSASKAPVVSPPADAITIDEIKILSGRPIRAGLLFGCYFMLDSNGSYSFFDRDNQLLQDNIQSGVSFDFSLNAGSLLNWNMTATIEAEDNKIVAKGNWSFGKPHNPHDDDIDDGEDGTFHAQAGGGGADAEKASSAKAS